MPKSFSFEYEYITIETNSLPLSMPLVPIQRRSICFCDKNGNVVYKIAVKDFEDAFEKCRKLGLKVRKAYSDIELVNTFTIPEDIEENIIKSFLE